MSAVWLSLFISTIAPQPELRPVLDGIGLRVQDFTLRDHRGIAHSLRDCKDSKLIVVVFLSVDCPLSKLYGPRLADLAKDFDGRGVAVLGIHANPHETLTSLARYAREYGITFPLLRDVGNDVVARFGAKRTPEAFILDESRTIRYRGRIDDQYGVGLQRQTVASRDLTEALEELLAGKTVSRPVTAPVGCRISQVLPAGKGSVTYTKDVVPILQRRCQECHRSGQIAPFPLTS
jgi:peroxiredoxin